MNTEAARAAREFAEIFPAIYLHFHMRRDRRAPTMTAQMWAVLSHLAHAGPLTVGEAARHMERAQSVMSGIIDGLVRKGLLARVPDSRDRRRQLVWLTDEGHAAMAAERRVLSEELLARAMTRMTPGETRKLLAGIRALRAAADELRHEHKEKRT